jgi:hypothetical protein
MKWAMNPDKRPKQRESKKEQESNQARAPRDPSLAYHALVGSEVLEAIGSRGAPRRAMHDIIHAPDDEKVERHLGPEEEAHVSFRADEELGDAGSDFAEEFGRSYLVAATTGEDMSEIEEEAADAELEAGGPFSEVDITPAPKPRRRHRPTAK